MDKIFYDKIKEEKTIEKNDRLLLAISGGPDSMYLLYNVIDLKKEFNLDLLVCHVNHGIRENAKNDENFVIDICKKFNINYNIKHVNMNEYAKENNMSAEEAGRFLRYEFFKENADGRKILTAHNLNDQAETILTRIFRGTGVKGLAGILQFNNNIVRPILNIPRYQIEDYLNKNNLKYVIDETNLKSDYTRNRIRIELIPYIEKYFNPNIVNTLNRLSINAREEKIYLDTIIEKEYRNSFKDYYFNVIYLKTLDKFICQEVIKKFLEENFPSFVTRKIIIDIYMLLFKNSGTSIDISKNIRARISYDKLLIEKYQKINYESLYLNCGDNHSDFGIITLKDNIYKKDRFNVSIDKDKIKGNLYVRSRKKGDRFTPMGMKSNKKLKDFFIDKKIDREKRDSIGLICDDENIIWVIGYGINDKYKITEFSKNILNMEVKDDRN